jgi:rubrerythrin
MNNIHLNDLLIEAMNSEIKAKEFYEEASIKAQSQAGKKLFKELADFERNHYERVKKILESRKMGNIILRDESVQEIPRVRSEVEGEFEPNRDEIVNVISIAIESEKNAHERYLKMAKMFDNEEEKKIFNDLAEEERKHQRILEDEFYHMSNKGTIIWE